MESGYLKNLKMRKLTTQDLEQFNDLLRYAFQVTEEELIKVGWEDDDIRQSKSPVLTSSKVWGWFDKDKLVSQIAIYPMKINIHGEFYSMGFITGVATYPEYSGHGLLSKLMKKALTQMKEKGQTISLLYPYSIPLYRHKGWEIISDKMTFSIKDFQLPKNLTAPGIVKRVEEDSPDLIKLHEKFAKKTHGCIFRNDLAWEEYWRWDVDDITIAIYYDKNETPKGYMVYLLNHEIFNIKEMVYLNTEAWKGLWGYIYAHQSMITEVKGNNYSNTPIAFWLDDSDIRETIRPYIMGRIIDVKSFLNKYPFKIPDTYKKITFSIKDNMLDWNNKNLTLEFTPLKAPIISENECEEKIELSIGTLTTMLMGYKTPSYLHNIEHIKGKKSTINFLETIIPHQKAYISDYI